MSSATPPFGSKPTATPSHLGAIPVTAKVPGASPWGQTSANPASLLPGVSHNTYPLYVEDQSDLIGLVAYSLYKSHKIAFREREFARTGKNPTAAEVDTFCSVFNTPQHVAMLRDRAGQLLGDMNKALLDEAIEELNLKYDERLVKELKEGAGWLKVGLQGVWGNTATAGIVALIVFGASSGKIGFIPTLADWAGYNTTERAPSK